MLVFNTNADSKGFVNMPKMGKAETQYYLERLTLFRNPNQLATSIGVTYPTITRWIRREARPSDVYRRDFKRTFDKLIKELENSGSYGQDMADFLTEQSVPHDSPPATLVRSNHAVLRDLLIEHIPAKGIKTHDLFKVTDSYGYSRASVHKAAKDLGVNKQPVGFGPKSYSVWKLT